MKKLILLLLSIITATSLVACSSSTSDYESSSKSSYGSSSSGSSYGSSSSKSDYDYDKGYGYTAPKEGESLSDYIKRQDPDLYKSMEDRLNSLAD